MHTQTQKIILLLIYKISINKEKFLRILEYLF